MKNSKMYFPLVVTDSEQNDIIVATATLILEQKFIRNCALKGRVEEVRFFNTFKIISISSLNPNGVYKLKNSLDSKLQTVTVCSKSNYCKNLSFY